MAVYAYVCMNCGEAVEIERRLVEDARHIDAAGVVCGILRRDYSTVNVNKSNLRKAH